MSDPSLRRIERIFHEALERLADERGAFLAEACGDDAELRAEVDRLLSAEAQGFSLLDSAPWKRQHVASEVKVTSDPHACAGARVGRYRLIRQVAAGGMGTVWLGERADGHYEQRVAVKLIKRGMDTDDVLHRFRRERQVLAQLRHPNIARLLDGGATDDGRPYLVMEYVEGRPIDEWCDARKLSIRQRLEVFLKVCEAVRIAHANLVVHRDLKPGNVLIEEWGTGVREGRPRRPALPEATWRSRSSLTSGLPRCCGRTASTGR